MIVRLPAFRCRLTTAGCAPQWPFNKSNNSLPIISPKASNNCPLRRCRTLTSQQCTGKINAIKQTLTLNIEKISHAATEIYGVITFSEGSSNITIKLPSKRKTSIMLAGWALRFNSWARRRRLLGPGGAMGVRGS